MLSELLEMYGNADLVLEISQPENQAMGVQGVFRARRAVPMVFSGDGIIFGCLCLCHIY